VVREGDAAARRGRERTFLCLGRHVVRRLVEDFLVSLSSSSSLSSSVALFVGERDIIFARSPVGDDPPPLPPPPPRMVVRDTTEFALFVRTGNLLLSACLSEEPKYPYLELIAAAAA